MMLHLPVAILVAFSPIAVSDPVPHFDIVKECRFEGGATTINQSCSQDEAAALSRLSTEWAQFAPATRKLCMSSATSGGFASYVELLTCLEMTSEVANANHGAAPRGTSEPRPIQPVRPGVTVGEGH